MLLTLREYPVSQFMMRIHSKIPYHSFLAIVLVCLFAFGPATAVLSQVDQHKPKFRFQRIHEGLLSNNVSAIYQDSFGYIWVGTHSGLHRYDGIEFHTYTNSSDTNSINNNTVEAIYEDRNHNLWVGTTGGVCRYDREKDNFTRFEFESNIPKNRSGENFVNTILEDDYGTLWVSGSGRELYYYDEENENFVASGDFGAQQITSIATGGKDILWLATYGLGLLKFNTETGIVEASYTHDPADLTSIASDDIHVIEMDNDGALWVGTRGSGLDRLVIKKNGKSVFKHYLHEPGNPNSLGNNDIYALYLDSDGRLLVGNENGGLHLYNRESDSFYRYENDPNDPHSLSHNSIWSIYEDREGRHWIGTGLTGLNVADPYATKFIHYGNTHTAANELNNNIIRDFLELEDGNILVATDGGGVNYFDRESETFTAFTHEKDDPHSVGSNAIIDISRNEEGEIWVGTWGGGLNLMVDKQEGRFNSFQHTVDNHQLSLRRVFDVHFDHENDDIWIPDFGEALYRYNPNSRSFDTFNPDSENPTSISSNYIFRIFEDSNHNLWFSTNAGVNLLKSEHKKEGIFKRFSHSEEDSTTIPSNSINQIFEDSNSTIWIATDDGLAKYIEKREGFVTYRESDGLPSDEIKSIIEDDSGYLWVGTIKGISRVDPSNMTFRNYDKNDGLQGNEFSRYSTLKLSTGELLFGGMNGFNLFHPDSLSDNPHKPPVYFTDFKLFNKSVSVHEKISPLNRHISVADTVTLTHNQSTFTFEFIALNFTKPDQNRYAYKMEGFEENWNYVGTQRNATYTNLDPGSYTFRVKASNNDGVWNEEGASLAVIIIPPFWQTTWFYMLSVLVVGGMIVGGYRYRMGQIQAQNRYLEQEVSARTSELHKKNQDLKAALEELQDTKDELVEKAHKAGMADIATGVLHNVGNILNSVNTSAAVIEDTVRQSKLTGILRANGILREQIDRIETFIAEDPRGRQLLQYYLKLEDPLKNEHEKVLKQSQRLTHKINLIKEVIAAQQSYAGEQMDADQLSLSEIVEDALTLQAGSISRHGLTIRKNLQPVDPIIAQRSKLIHVLVNLLKNAKDAMADNPPDEKLITIKTWQNAERVFLSVADNGSGIQPEHMSKVFSHGFTTKKNGHGFGLHSSANYMKEMEGSISVDSDGEGQGTTFTLSFTKNKKNVDRPVQEQAGLGV